MTRPVSDAGETEAQRLWRAWHGGDAGAQEALLAAYYGELRTIARRILRGDGAAQLLQPTELANEAVLRLLRLERIAWGCHEQYWHGAKPAFDPQAFTQGGAGRVSQRQVDQQKVGLVISHAFEGRLARAGHLHVIAGVT